MISFHDAVTIIKNNRLERGEVSVSLGEALGQVCARDVRAKLTQPPFAASAMDGYAVNFGVGISREDHFEVIGEAPAGVPFQGAVSAGQAVRLFTGSVMPEGTDHVIIQEDVARERNMIRVIDAQPVGRNVRAAGIDFAKDDIVIGQGTKLSPAHLALAAAANHAQIDILKPLNIALLACGDELRVPGSDIQPGQIISSNQTGLTAILESWGMNVQDLGIARDDPEDIKARIAKAHEADIIIPIGGASVGDHDHMRACFKALGYESCFEKVAVRPGKPTWMAKKNGQIAFGLPGNPASAYVCAYVFLPILLGLRDSIQTVELPVAADLKANGPRDHFIRAVIKHEVGQLIAMPITKMDSSLITPLAQSNALIHLPAGASASQSGDRVSVIPITELDL